jgi:hypothetical protein
MVSSAEETERCALLLELLSAKFGVSRVLGELSEDGERKRQLGVQHKFFISEKKAKRFIKI